MCLIIDDKQTSKFKKKTGSVKVWKVLSPSITKGYAITPWKLAAVQSGQEFLAEPSKPDIVTIPAMLDMKGKEMLPEIKTLEGGVIHVYLSKEEAELHVDFNDFAVECTADMKDFIACNENKDEGAFTKIKLGKWK
jgi:hypothetical protein